MTAEGKDPVPEAAVEATVPCCSECGSPINGFGDCPRAEQPQHGRGYQTIHRRAVLAPTDEQGRRELVETVARALAGGDDATTQRRRFAELILQALGLLPGQEEAK